MNASLDAHTGRSQMHKLAYTLQVQTHCFKKHETLTLIFYDVENQKAPTFA